MAELALTEVSRTPDRFYLVDKAGATVAEITEAEYRNLAVSGAPKGFVRQWNRGELMAIQAADYGGKRQLDEGEYHRTEKGVDIGIVLRDRGLRTVHVTADETTQVSRDGTLSIQATWPDDTGIESISDGVLRTR